MWVLAKPHGPRYNEKKLSGHLRDSSLPRVCAPEDLDKRPFYPPRASRGWLMFPTKLNSPPVSGTFTATILSGRSKTVRVPYCSSQNPFYNRGKHTVYISITPSVFLLISPFKYKQVAKILSKATTDHRFCKW